ncbi:MAG: diacylglycerol kinase family lipid kinase [Deltaproteobacteria bacterium]|nr:diacylglycerol kinase family lipid kinase [Deltaproteobacteria bacterium]
MTDPPRESLCLVVNPRAGSGTAGRRLARLARLAEEVFPTVDVRRTEDRGHASLLARSAAAEGFDVVAAVGGDGTCHEVVNGLMDPGASSGPELPAGGGRLPVFTVVPFGTGSDLIRSLGIPRDTRAALRLARVGETRSLDVGWARTHGPEGEQIHRYFVNELSFGMSGEVVARVNRSSKRLGGRVSFLGATLSTLAAARPSSVRITWEGPQGSGSWDQPFLASFVANGQYCGGGMWVGRGGSMTDGLLDVTVVPALSVLKAIPSLPRLYNGTTDRVPGAVRVLARKVEARALDPAKSPIPVETDGEQAGYLPLVLEVRPNALRVCGAW